MTESDLSVRDAAYHVVKDYPGGAVALAARLGMRTAATLSHKVSPNSTHYYLSLEEAVNVQAFTGDDRILFAMARELGYVCIRIDQSDEEHVNEKIVDTVREFGAYLQSVTEAIQDKQVTDREVSEIAAHMGSVMAQFNLLHATVLAINARNKKPKGPVAVKLNKVGR